MMVVDTHYSQNTQIYSCTLEAKFDIQKSDIKDSFEIMKLLENLSKQKVNKQELSSALQEIEKLKKSIKNQKLYEIINKNSTKVINDIKIQNNISVNVHVDEYLEIDNNITTNVKVDEHIKIENYTDKLLYYIIGGLILLMVIMLILLGRKQKVNVTVENPNFQQVVDDTKQDKTLHLSLDKEVFYRDDKLSIHFKIEHKIKEWYIYAFNIDDEKNIVSLDLIEGDKVVSDREYIFPTWSDGYDISEPFGNDIIKIFVSDKKIDKPNLNDSKSEVFQSSNHRGLDNTTIQKEISTQKSISKYDIVAYYRGHQDRCTIFERSIHYVTKEGLEV